MASGSGGRPRDGVQLHPQERTSRLDGTQPSDPRFDFRIVGDELSVAEKKRLDAQRERDRAFGKLPDHSIQAHPGGVHDAVETLGAGIELAPDLSGAIFAQGGQSLANPSAFQESRIGDEYQPKRLAALLDPFAPDACQDPAYFGEFAPRSRLPIAGKRDIRQFPSLRIHPGEHFRQPRGAHAGQQAFEFGAHPGWIDFARWCRTSPIHLAIGAIVVADPIRIEVHPDGDPPRTSREHRIHPSRRVVDAWMVRMGDRLRIRPDTFALVAIAQSDLLVVSAEPADSAPPGMYLCEMDPNLTRWMEETFELALAARGTTLPNPSVGCIVLDRTGKPIAKASTHPGGRPHAERAALERSGARARGGFLLATLEPCVAFPGKKSPPCAAAIILSGVETVVVGSRDPNPLVSGKGIHAMRKAGIKVIEQTLSDRIPDFYAGFGHFLTTRRPRVTLKAALSSDGMATSATGTRTAITGVEARRFTHGLRAATDLVLVGGSTARIDDPELTVRDAPGRSPRRAVLWPRDGLPATLKLFQGGSTLAIGCGRRPETLPASATWMEIPSDGEHPSLGAMLDRLGEHGYHDLLVEPGPRLARSFLDAELWDRFWLIRSPAALGGGEPFRLEGLTECVRPPLGLGADAAFLHLRS